MSYLPRFGALLAALALATPAACSRGSARSVDTFLTAVEREVDHGVNLAVTGCKPERGDQDAGQAADAAKGFQALLTDGLTCVSTEKCVKSGAGDEAKGVESRLPEQARLYAKATRESLDAVLASGPGKARRAHVGEVLTDAAAVMTASEKLIQICGSNRRMYEMSDALTAMEQARARFRTALKLMRADAS